MTVDVLLFGPHAAALKARAVPVALGQQACCGDIPQALATQYPAIAHLLTGARIAVNAHFVASSTPVGPTDEVALVALVGGG